MSRKEKKRKKRLLRLCLRGIRKCGCLRTSERLWAHTTEDVCLDLIIRFTLNKMMSALEIRGRRTSLTLNNMMSALEIRGRRTSLKRQTMTTCTGREKSEEPTPRTRLQVRGEGQGGEVGREGRGGEGRGGEGDREGRGTGRGGEGRGLGAKGAREVREAGGSKSNTFSDPDVHPSHTSHTCLSSHLPTSFSKFFHIQFPILICVHLFHQALHLLTARV
jgi:hypothetical protein